MCCRSCSADGQAPRSWLRGTASLPWGTWLAGGCMSCATPASLEGVRAQPGAGSQSPGLVGCCLWQGGAGLGSPGHIPGALGWAASRAGTPVILAPAWSTLGAQGWGQHGPVMGTAVPSKAGRATGLRLPWHGCCLLSCPAAGEGDMLGDGQLHGHCLPSPAPALGSTCTHGRARAARQAAALLRGGEGVSEGQAGSSRHTALAQPCATGAGNSPSLPAPLAWLMAVPPLVPAQSSTTLSGTLVPCPLPVEEQDSWSRAPSEGSAFKGTAAEHVCHDATVLPHQCQTTAQSPVAITDVFGTSCTTACRGASRLSQPTLPRLTPADWRGKHVLASPGPQGAAG